MYACMHVCMYVCMYVNMAARQTGVNIFKVWGSLARHSEPYRDPYLCKGVWVKTSKQDV